METYLDIFIKELNDYTKSTLYGSGTKIITFMDLLKDDTFDKDDNVIIFGLKTEKYNGNIGTVHSVNTNGKIGITLPNKQFLTNPQHLLIIKKNKKTNNYNDSRNNLMEKIGPNISKGLLNNIVLMHGEFINKENILDKFIFDINDFLNEKAHDTTNPTYKDITIGDLLNNDTLKKNDKVFLFGLNNIKYNNIIGTVNKDTLYSNNGNTKIGVNISGISKLIKIKLKNLIIIEKYSKLRFDSNQKRKIVLNDYLKYYSDIDSNILNRILFIDGKFVIKDIPAADVTVPVNEQNMYASIPMNTLVLIDNLEMQGQYGRTNGYDSGSKIFKIVLNDGANVDIPANNLKFIKGNNEALKSNNETTTKHTFKIYDRIKVKICNANNHNYSPHTKDGKCRFCYKNQKNLIGSVYNYYGNDLIVQMKDDINFLYRYNTNDVNKYFKINDMVYVNDIVDRPAIVKTIQVDNIIIEYIDNKEIIRIAINDLHTYIFETNSIIRSANYRSGTNNKTGKVLSYNPINMKYDINFNGNIKRYNYNSITSFDGCNFDINKSLLINCHGSILSTEPVFVLPKDVTIITYERTGKTLTSNTEHIPKIFSNGISTKRELLEEVSGSGDNKYHVYCSKHDKKYFMYDHLLDFSFRDSIGTKSLEEFIRVLKHTYNIDITPNEIKKTNKSFNDELQQNITPHDFAKYKEFKRKYKPNYITQGFLMKGEFHESKKDEPSSNLNSYNYSRLLKEYLIQSDTMEQLMTSKAYYDLLDIIKKNKGKIYLSDFIQIIYNGSVGKINTFALFICRGIHGPTTSKSVEGGPTGQKFLNKRLSVSG